MKNPILFLLAALLISTATHAQRTCGTTEYMQQQYAKNPKLALARQELEKKIAAWPQSEAARRQGQTVMTVPVVFHVIYSNSQQNVSDALLMAQLNVLNEDFRKLNTDVNQTPSLYQSLAADTEIQFCLAQRDPDGNPSTGITRTQTSVSSFGLNDNMKFTSQGGKNAWNTSQYLNIWVCNLGGGLLGYAYQPGTSAANVDGVVLGYFTLPGGVGAPFNEGRTATHEIGHYFNLDHIWGPGNGGNCASDLVADTPPQNYPNYDCPTFPSPSCNNQGDMHMNYMDYVNDACMYMFTTGQKTRMQAAISASRGGLLTSQGCVPVVLPALDIALTSIVSPTATVPSGALAPQVIIKNAGQNIITTATIAYSIDNGPSVSYTWNGNLASQATATVSLPATTISAGVHNIVVTTTMAGDANATNNTSSRSFNAISSSGQAQSFEGTFPPTNYGVTGTTANYRWQQTSLAAKTGANSMFVDNYDINAPGNRTDLTLPATNLSSFSNVQLTFAVAHKMYSQTTSNPDSLEVLISTNGGQTYTSIYKKGGVSLATGSGSSTTSEYVPALASDWRTETISLTPYNSSTNAIIKIRAINRYGNNLYVDDIMIDGTTGSLEENTASALVTLYPNPASGSINFDFGALPTGNNPALEITDVLGRIVAGKTILEVRNNSASVNVSHLKNGVYLARITTGNSTVIKRFVISK